MSTIALDCPHCKNKRVGFHSVGYSLTTLSGLKKRPVHLVFFKCNICQKGVVADVELISGPTPPHEYPAGLQGWQSCGILDIYPKSAPVAVPDYLPDNIANLYLQAAKNLVPGMWDSAAMMGRRVLEAALKKLRPGLEGNLFKRIEILAQENIITRDIKEWAHAIRNDGNDAAHEEDLMDEDTAKELMSFVEVFLMYTFTLPKMVEARRNRKKPAESE